MDSVEFLQLQIGDVIVNLHTCEVVEVTARVSPSEAPNYWIAADCVISGEDKNIMAQDAGAWVLLNEGVFRSVCENDPLVGALLLVLSKRVSEIERFIDLLRREVS